MQAKPLFYACEVLMKNIIYSENMCLTGLKHCAEDLNSLGICLT
jgi:hypothetical protein